MTAALIIASGRTARKGNFEPLAEVGTIPAIQRIVVIFQQAHIERIVVVCDNDKKEKLAAHMNVVYLPGSGEAEMLDNVKTGLNYLADKCSSVVITHVNVPLFSVETVRALLAADSPVNVPSHSGKAGHPLLLRSEGFNAILSYSGDGGLAGALEASGLRQNPVNVEDEGILVNVHYEKSYEHLVKGDNIMAIRPDIKIRINREKPFYGPGTHQLLQLTMETGSLFDACRHMGISYSKGRKIITLMEQQLGYPILESKKGGTTGGYSTVTEKGKELFFNYSEFCREAKQSVGELFQKYFTLS